MKDVKLIGSTKIEIRRSVSLLMPDDVYQISVKEAREQSMFSTSRGTVRVSAIVRDPKSKYDGETVYQDDDSVVYARVLEDWQIATRGDDERKGDTRK